MKKEKETLIAFFTALGLHLIGGWILLMSVDFSLPKDKPENAAPIINASVVDQKLFDDLDKRKNEKIATEKRKIEAEKKKQERIKQEKIKADQLVKQKEAKRIKAEKAEVLRKQKEVQRIEAEKVLVAKQLKAKKQAEKAKKVADEKHRKEQVRKVEEERVRSEKRAADKVKAEKAAKAAKVKSDKLAAKKAAKEKERLRQADLDRQMEAEFADAFSSAQSSKQLSEIARYKALIQDKISRNWQVKPSMKGKTCTLAIRLAADGLVLSAKYSKGDKQLCESAKRAALRARTLPIPKDPVISSQFRDFDITLEPDF
jgi:colicin import membrane protein